MGANSVCGTLLVSLLVAQCMVVISNAEDVVLEIGAILDTDSTVGKEERVAMLMAVRDFNYTNLTFSKPSHGAVSSFLAAEELISKKKVKAIVGMNRWEEAAAVAEASSRARIPIVSFAAPAVTTQSDTGRWPSVVKMERNNAEQMKCIAGMLRAYNWRRIVPVYEKNLLGESSDMLSLLLEEIHGDDVMMEYSLAIPPLESLPDPEAAISAALHKLTDVKSRVFIVLQVSLPMMIHLFRKARQMELMNANNVWILTARVANYLDLVNTSVIHSMEGVVGVRYNYSSRTSGYHTFRKQFHKMMTNEYPNEDLFEPGYNALRAYDTIKTIALAQKKSPRSSTDSQELTSGILSADFEGQSGRIKFKDSQLSNDSLLRVINVVGKRYQEIDYWIPGFGFAMNISVSHGKAESRKLSGHVIWPGDSKQPKGWAVPTSSKPMKIGLPGKVVFNKFLNVSNKTYDGFCIDLFRTVIERLGYSWDSFSFEVNDGTYDHLIDLLHSKAYDGVLGDFTVLSSRTDLVEFASSFMDSSLSTIVLAIPENSTWIFTKPFSRNLWLASAGVLIYTAIVVWLMERKTSPEFGDSWKDQIVNAIMFTLCSVFFVHREKLHHALSRVVLIVWLCVVLVLTSSFTASLSSMLTVPKLRPSNKDIQWLVNNNVKVGCDSGSFLYNYLQKVHKFKAENIVEIKVPRDYAEGLRNRSIYAAIMETPYKNAFFTEYSYREFTENTYMNRFGGLSFAFQKGSPLVGEVSKTIMELKEEGKMMELEERWFSKRNVSDSDISHEELNLENFWALHVISFGISTVCLLLFFCRRFLHYHKHVKRINNGELSPSPSELSVWKKTRKMASFVFNGEDAMEVECAKAFSLTPLSSLSPVRSEIECMVVPYSPPSSSTCE